MYENRLGGAAAPVAPPLATPLLIDGIKSNRQINKSKTVDLLMIHGLDDVIMHRKKSSFSKMMLMWADWNELSKLLLDRYSENLV